MTTSSYVSTREAALLVGVNRATVTRWLQAGVIRGVRVGRNYRVSPDEVRRMVVDAQKVDA